MYKSRLRLTHKLFDHELELVKVNGTTTININLVNDIIPDLLLYFCQLSGVTYERCSDLVCIDAATTILIKKTKCEQQLVLGDECAFVNGSYEPLCELDRTTAIDIYFGELVSDAFPLVIILCLECINELIDGYLS